MRNSFLEIWILTLTLPHLTNIYTYWVTTVSKMYDSPGINIWNRRKYAMLVMWSTSREVEMLWGKKIHSFAQLLTRWVMMSKITFTWIGAFFFSITSYHLIIVKQKNFGIFWITVLVLLLLFTTYLHKNGFGDGQRILVQILS